MMRRAKAMRRSLARVGLGLAATFAPAAATAQLISPGKLSTDHASLEGIRGCTNCHDLGRKGASSTKCLSCHEPLATRVAAGRGFHAELATTCANCHKEHFGREFALVRLDSASFDHARTGWKLEGAHGTVRCGECHEASRTLAPDVREWVGEHTAAAGTLLGLPTACSSCHSTDDPHGGQFRQACDVCHDSGDWARPTRFDHARTGYPLTGRHRAVECAGCHSATGSGGNRVVRYSGTPAGSCTTCHADRHAGSMGPGCTTCHDTGGWKRVDAAAVAGRFDHSSTRFPLRGGHADTGCAGCHVSGASATVRPRFASSDRGTYPRPQFDRCDACHLDRHEGQLGPEPERLACDRCHTESGWSPAGFDIERHATETRFPLTGAHLYTPCTTCHESTGPAGPRFAIEDVSCAGCHAADSPHEEIFGDRTCDGCHTTATFGAGTFDHGSITGQSCATCHADDDPHAGQFDGASCDTCHGTDAFAIPAFDHSVARFALDGAHETVRCVDCHPSDVVDGRSIVRYRPRPVDCSACHGVSP